VDVYGERQMGGSEKGRLDLARIVLIERET